MAVIDAKGVLHGKLGPYVYRKVGSKAIVQSKAAKVRQSISTKKSALEFGLASNAAKIVRTAFFPLTYTADGGMINRLSVATLKCIKNSDNKARGERDLHDADLRYLEGFQFNKHCPLNEALQMRPIAELDKDNRMKVQIPAFKDIGDLQHPIHSQSCVLRLMVVAINFKENYYEYSSYRDIEINKRELFEGEEWHPEEVLPAGSIAFLSVSLHYFSASGRIGAPVSLNSKDCSPAEILAVFKVPAVDEETIAVERIARDSALHRFPMNNYRGGEILTDLQKLRQGQEKKQGKDLARTVTINNKRLDLPKGKIEVQKE